MSKLIIIGGKGGTGKSTVSCSLGVNLAEAGKKVLVVSSDPAHSISDSLQQQMTSKPTKVYGVNGSFFGMELNPDEMIDKDNLDFANDKWAQLIGIDKVNQDMMRFPGIDEYWAFLEIEEFLSKNQFDYIIMDTPPSGHSLRFLSLPQLMDSWVDTMKTMYSRVHMIRSFIGKKKNARKIFMEVKAKMAMIREQFEDPETTSFLLVLIPELMAIEETKRTRWALSRYKIPVSGCIINNITPRNDICKQCYNRNDLEKRYIDKIKEEFEDMSCAQIPRYQSEIIGIDSLRMIGKQITCQIDVEISSKFKFDMDQVDFSILSSRVFS